MDKIAFARHLKYPPEWVEWNMYTDELFQVQLGSYQHDEDIGEGEHYRYGAFRYWLQRKLTTVQSENLVKLSFLDPDQFMARNVRQEILSKNSPET